MTGIYSNHVLEVVAGKAIVPRDKLWETLLDEQLAVISAVSMDMWQAFMTSTERDVPHAEIVYDKFYVSEHLKGAVDKVRRDESKKKLRSGGMPQKGSSILASN